MKPLRSALACAIFVIAGASLTACSSDKAATFASSPDAATVCAPPFCLVVNPDAGAGATPAAVDASTGPGGKAPPAGKTPPGGTTPTVTVIGVPIGGTTPVTFVGGGKPGDAPLAPGCTPASALECPTTSGACATSATSHPVDVVQGVLCTYGGPFTVASGKPAATVEYLHETAGGKDYYRFRITFDPSFVDNTYGTNAIGWGDKGHTWKDLLGSDHAELELFDNNHVMVAQLKIDYIGLDTTQTCGIASLGVSGGDGKMLVGDPAWVLGATSSLARNLEGCGYCTSPACGGDCKVNSPATDDKWTSNPATPNWDYRVRYEVWIDAAAFGTSGFGGVNVSYVHASPSKESTNTITVIPGPCPPPPGGCEPGYVEYVTSEGAATCVPTTNVPPDCKPTETQILTSEGAITCVPTTTPPCKEGEQALITEGGTMVCVPTGTTPPRDAGTPPTCQENELSLITEGGTMICAPTVTPPAGCKEGELALVTEGGKTACLPPGTCPTGAQAYLTSEGAIDCQAPIP